MNGPVRAETSVIAKSMYDVLVKRDEFNHNDLEEHIFLFSSRRRRESTTSKAIMLLLRVRCSMEDLTSSQLSTRERERRHESEKVIRITLVRRMMINA